MAVKIIANDSQVPRVDIVVCFRVADLALPPNKPAEKETCSECGHAIWVQPTSPLGPPRMCTVCVMAHLKKTGDEVGLVLTENSANNLTPEAAALMAPLRKMAESEGH